MNARSIALAAVALAMLVIADPVQAQESVKTTLDPVTTLTRMVRVSGLMASVVVILGAWLLLRFANGLVARLGVVFAERRLLLQRISAFFRFGVYFTTILLVIVLSFEISREVLAILGGTAAVAMGFAMKDLVASVVSGVMIILDRPFQVGDRVGFGGKYGDVITIGLRSVKLRTLDDSVVTIPNSMFLSEVTTCGNYGVLNMQIVIDFLISVDQDVDRARAIVREAAATSCYIYLPNPIDVLVTQVVSDNYLALRLRLKAYVLDTQYEKVFETDVTLRVMRAFREEEIHTPAILHQQVGSGTRSRAPSAGAF